MNEWNFLSSFTRRLIDFLSSANTKENMLMNVGNQTILATIDFYSGTFLKISFLCSTEEKKNHTDIWNNMKLRNDDRISLLFCILLNFSFTEHLDFLSTAIQLYI